MQRRLTGDQFDVYPARNKITDFATGKTVNYTPEERVRQLFERRLVEEYGYAKSQIDIEFQIQKGSHRIGPADIVVFMDSRKSFDNILVVVETKRQDRKDGLDQLMSYLSPTSAEFGVWFNGKEIVYIQNLKKPPYFREIADIPKKGESLADIGLYQKKDLKPAIELKSVFETCHNYIYANEGFLKEKVFNEVLKLIFIKMVDEKSANPKCEFRITDNEMTKIEEGKPTNFDQRILDLFERVKKEYADVFDQNDRINLKSLSLAYVVGQLQKYSLIRTATDVKGTAFQTIVYAHQRGERGEFFTPYPILDLAVSMLNPKDGEMVLDPACGSAGFLVTAMEHVWSNFEKQRTDLNERELKDVQIRYARNYLRGIDFNPDLARVSKMRMVLYDDGHAGIFSENSLESFEIIEKTTKGEIRKESADVALTNPPFGSKGKITSKMILQQFDLGHKWLKNKGSDILFMSSTLFEGQIPDILFIERCLQFLRYGGRMAIVLPNSDLNNITYEYVIEYIKQKSRILAVVSLPFGTFKHSGPNIKTSLLFLQKLPKEKLLELQKNGYPIFMAAIQNIGFDLRTKVPRLLYKRNQNGELVLDERNNPILETDVPEVITEFAKFREDNNLGF